MERLAPGNINRYFRSKALLPKLLHRGVILWYTSDKAEMNKTCGWPVGMLLLMSELTAYIVTVNLKDNSSAFLPQLH